MTWNNPYGNYSIIKKAVLEGRGLYPSFFGQVCLRGIGQYIAEQVSHWSPTKIDAKVTVLGHVQRGGIPSALDRIIATAFGKVAVDLISYEKYDQIVTWQNGQVVCLPLEEALLRSPSPVNPKCELVQTAKALGIYVGELSN